MKDKYKNKGKIRLWKKGNVKDEWKYEWRMNERNRKGKRINKIKRCREIMYEYIDEG